VAPWAHRTQGAEGGLPYGSHGHMPHWLYGPHEPHGPAPLATWAPWAEGHHGPMDSSAPWPMWLMGPSGPGPEPQIGWAQRAHGAQGARGAHEVPWTHGPQGPKGPALWTPWAHSPIGLIRPMGQMGRLHWHLGLHGNHGALEHHQPPGHQPSLSQGPGSSSPAGIDNGCTRRPLAAFRYN